GCGSAGSTRAGRSRGCGRRRPLAPNPLSSSPDRAQPHPPDQSASQPNRPPVEREFALGALVRRPDPRFGGHHRQGELGFAHAEIHDGFRVPGRGDCQKIVRSLGLAFRLRWGHHERSDHELVLGIGELNESGAQRDFEKGLVGRRIEDAAARRTRPPGATQPRQQSKPADITRRNLTDRAPRGVGGREHRDAVHLAKLPGRSELVQNHLHVPDPKTLTHEFLVSRYLLLAAVSVAVVPTSLTAQGQFGQALAVSGREVYVGQPGNAYGPGVVYIFQAATNGAWRATKKLTMPAATNGDGFGSAIAIDGNTLLVGSTKADSGRGAVYLFTREATSGWREGGRIT